MSVKHIIKSAGIKILDFINYKRLRRNEIKKIKEKKRIAIQRTITLNKEQKKQIDSFYKENYGKRIPYYWHKEYYAISGKFDYRYYPELLFIPGFERLVNNPNYYKCLGDKNIVDLIGNNVSVKSPKVFVRCANGVITDENRNVISLEESYIVISKLDKFFIKPSVDSSSGNGCNIIRHDTVDSYEKYVNLLRTYKNDYIIQDVLKNSKDISKLNSTSLNTFRVITYILNRKIYHMPVILRIGRNGKILDNAHQGGIFIGVTDDGLLLKQATSEFNEKYETHPDTNIIFENYKISNFNKIIEAAEKLQSLIPHVGCVNWDLTLDENEDVVLIEGNMRYGSIWLIQMAHGVSGFGDNTADILRLIRDNKKLY